MQCPPLTSAWLALERCNIISNESRTQLANNIHPFQLGCDVIAFLFTGLWWKPSIWPVNGSVLWPYGPVCVCVCVCVCVYYMSLQCVWFTRHLPFDSVSIIFLYYIIAVLVFQCAYVSVCCCFSISVCFFFSMFIFQYFSMLLFQYAAVSVFQ